MASDLVSQIPTGPTDTAIQVDDQQAQEQRRQNLIAQIPTETPGRPVVTKIEYEREDETKATTDEEFFAIRNRNRLAERDAALRAALRQGLQKDPDTAAKLDQAAKEQGVDPRLIEDRLVEYNRRKLEQDYYLSARNTEVVGNNLLNPMFAAQAGSDIPALVDMEKIVGGIVSYVVGARPKGGLVSDVYSGLGQASAGIGQATLEGGAELLKLVGLGDNTVTSELERLGKMYGEMGEASKAQRSESANFWVNAVTGGLESGVQSAKYLPLIAAGPPGTAVALTMLASETFGRVYNEDRSKGVAPGRAFAHATADGFYEYAFERMLGIGGFMNKIMSGSSAGKLMMYEITREIPGEVATTIAQNFNEWALINPEKSLSQFLSEQPADILQTVIGTIVGGAVQTGAARGGIKVFESVANRQLASMEAYQKAEMLKQTMELAKNIQLATRSPAEFSRVVNEMAGDAEIRFDARTLSQTLQKANITPEQAAQMFPSLGTQLQEQSINNGEVTIPVGEFITGTRDMEGATQLQDIARIGDSELSQAEAKEAVATANQYLQDRTEQVLAQVEDRQTWETSTESVRSKVFEQLQRAGRTTRDANRWYADLQANVFSTMAQRFGTTPEELYNRYNLQTVRGIDIQGATPEARLQNAVMQAGQPVNTNAAITALADPTLQVFRVEGRTGIPVQLTTEAEIQATPPEQLRVMPQAVMDQVTGELTQSGREGGDTTYSDLARSLLDAMQAPQLSSVTLVDNAAERPTFANNTELAAYFTEKNGQLAANLEDPTVISQIVDAIYAESLHALTDAGNAIGWYDRKTKAALNIMAVAHPEILTDEQSRFAFTVILAVTSNGLRSRDNFVIAEELYRNVWKKDKMFPDSVPKGGKSMNQMEKSFALMNRLMDQMGWEKLRDFMVQTHAARDVVKFAGLNATKAGNFGEQASTELMGALFLGPKIGSFFNNLYGDFSTITMDRWFMRTINRVRGRMLDLPGSFGKNLASLQVQLKGKIDTYGVDKKAIIAELKAFAKLPAEQQADVLAARAALPVTMEYVRARHRDYAKPKDDGTGKKRSYLDRSEENRLAKNIDLALNGTIDDPGGAKDRSWIRSIMGQVQGKLAADGIEITNADLQAVLWYYEKDLYEKLKTEQEIEDATEATEAKEAEDYETAARYAVSLLQQQGIVAGDAVVPRSATGVAQTLQQAQAQRGGGVAPTFYSALTRAVAGAKQESATAQDWISIIKKLPGVKAEEIALTGVEDYLLLAGKGKVSKQDVVDFLNANGVQVDEMMLGVNVTNKFVVTVNGVSSGGTFETEEDADNAVVDMVYQDMEAQGIRDTAENFDWFRSAYQIVPAEDVAAANGVEGLTKYGTYTLPGGSNYKELLLTLPGQAKFQSSHWDQLNVLAHIRFNERMDPEGNRVLFIEEMQSDWAQSGRKYGFPDEKPFKVFNVSDPQTIIAEFATLDEVTEFKQSNPYVEYTWQPQANKVPLAPFVQDTKSWVALTVKRMMRYAAENGFDKVAFVNGQQSADRYDLSKQVDQLLYKKNDDNTYQISAQTDGRGMLIGASIAEEKLEDYVGKDVAKKIIDGDGKRTEVQGQYDPVSMTQGKDYMQSLSGLDLKVGGEGMIQFYDRIVPQVVSEQLKKIGGGKLEAVSLETKSRINVGPINEWPVQPEYSMQSGKYYLVDQQGNRLDNYPEYESYDEAANAAIELNPKLKTDQPGFTITPKMRETIMAGLPMFQAGQDAARGTFDVNRMVIRLNESNDLSTFLHESGHFFLEMMADLSANANAPQDLKDDWSKVLQWANIDQAQWDAWTSEYRSTGAIPDGLRKVHESWAESFEQYLFEGKAPTKELIPMFRTFRSWLTRVYKVVQQMFTGGNQLSDEIRGVFDRMIATEEAIADAEERAGMTPEEQATAEAIEKLTARSLANLKWADNARSRYIRKLQSEAKSQRKEVRSEVEGEVEVMPVYRALRWISSGQMVSETGEEIKAIEGFKLDKAVVEALFPEGMANRPDLKKISRYTMKDGLHPDIVADMFGFRDGAHLILELVMADNIKAKIDAMTNQRMLERFGDMYNQEQIEQAADEAVHNDARAKAMAAELKAQEDAMAARQPTGRTDTRGRPITVNVLVAAAKAFADSISSRTLTKDLRKTIWKYRQAEARAGKAWAAATKKGNTEDAIQAKRDQLLNMQTVKAMQDAQAEVQKIMDLFNKITRGNNESLVSRGRNPDIVAAARAILASYGVGGRQAKSAVEYLTVLKSTDPDLYATMEASITGAMADAKDVKELTVQELRALKDEVESLWNLSKRSRQMEVEGQLFDMESLEQMLVGQMEANGVPQDVPGARGALTKSDIAATKLRTVRALLRRVEQWAESMDRKANGPFSRFIFQPIKQAADRYRKERTVYYKQYRDLVKSMVPFMDSKLIMAPELQYEFGRGHNGVGMAELLHAMLHTGNESNKRKLLVGRGWATVNEDGSLDTTKWDQFLDRLHRDGVLRKEHYDFMQSVWDMMEQMKAGAQKTHRIVFGRYFDEITAAPVVTPFGVYKGGYVPAQADPRLVTDASIRALAEAENENMSFSFPSTAKGFTKGRVEGYDRPLMLDLRSLSQHIDKVMLFTHMEPAVRDVNRLLRRRNVATTLNKIDNTVIESMLIPWLNRSARQQVETPIVGDGGVSKVLSVARSRAGMAAMFANVSNGVQQITGFTLGLLKVRNGHMRQALAQFAKSPRKMARDVAQLSSFMSDRMDNEISAINGTINEILLNESVYAKAQNWSMKHSYFVQTAIANTMEPIIWTAAYNQAIEDGMTEAQAISYADGTIRTTQGSTLPEDVSRIETGPSYARIFTQFIGYFNMLANTNATELNKIVKEVGVKRGAGKMFTVVMLGLLLPAWIGEAIAIAFRGGPDDEDHDGYLDDWFAQVFGMGTLKFTLATVPFAGQIVNAGINRFNGNPTDDRVAASPVVSFIESGVGAPASVYRAIVEEGSKAKAIKDVATLLTILTGLPFRALAKPIAYGADVAENRVTPVNPVDVMRGALTGTPSPESKTR